MSHQITYWLSQHPAILNFRWSQTESWGSTWSFLFTAIPAYVVAAVTIHLFLTLVLPNRRPVPLGPVPAVYSLAMALISAVNFLGMLLSAAYEIRDTRWFWRRTRKTPFEWLLCFPLGTRPSGRVFFWSYVFYLSRFLHLFRTFVNIFGRRKLTPFHLLNQCILTFKSFLWLEFSQSFQVLAILVTTLVNSVVYGYRFWTAIGLPDASFPLVLDCEVLLIGFNLVSHVGVLLLHFLKGGGCNGIGAWTCNSVLNGIVLVLFLNFYVKVHLKKTTATTSSNVGQEEAETGSASSSLDNSSGSEQTHDQPSAVKEKHS